jgi:hypothetical protein
MTFVSTAATTMLVADLIAAVSAVFLYRHSRSMLRDGVSSESGGAWASVIALEATIFCFAIAFAVYL